MNFPTLQETHRAIAHALLEQHAVGFDAPTRRYADTAWPGHELGSGDPNGAVFALAALADESQPREARDRWATHAPTISHILGPAHPGTLATWHNLAAWRGRAGDPDGAAASLEELLPLREEVLWSVARSFV